MSTKTKRGTKYQAPNPFLRLFGAWPRVDGQWDVRLCGDSLYADLHRGHSLWAVVAP